MKRFFIPAVLLLAAVMFGGCGAGWTVMHSPTIGLIYTGTQSPSMAATETEAVGTSKKGQSECMSVLGIAAWGDCSVEGAMHQGGVKKIHNVDHKTYLVLFGVYTKVTTIVYGE
jgi:hypothetical protein